MPNRSSITEQRALPGWTMLGSLRCPRRIAGQLAWSPNGRWLAASADDGSVYLWEMNPRRARGFDPQHARVLEFLHLGVVCSLAWSHDSRYLATGSTAGRVVIWPVDCPEPEWADYCQVGSLPVWVCWSPLTCILLCHSTSAQHGFIHLTWEPRRGFSDGPATSRSRLRLPLRNDTTLSLPLPENLSAGSFRLAWSPDVRSCAWLAGANTVEMGALQPPALAGAARRSKSQRREWRRRSLFRARAADPVSALSISAARMLLVASTTGGAHLLWAGDDGRSLGRLLWNPAQAYAGCADFHPTHNLLAASGRIAARIDLWEFDPEIVLSPLGPLSDGLALLREGAAAVAAGGGPAGAAQPPRCYLSCGPAQEAFAARLAALLTAAGVTVLAGPASLAADDWLVVIGAPGYYESAPAADLDLLRQRIERGSPPPRCIPALADPHALGDLPRAFAKMDASLYSFEENYSLALLHLLMTMHGVDVEDARFAAVRGEIRGLKRP